VTTPLAFIWSVSVLPLESENCELVSCERQNSFRAPADAPEIQITANLMLEIAPPVPVQTTSSQSKRICAADAPAVHVSLASALPLELYPLPDVTSFVSEAYVLNVAVLAFDALVWSVMRNAVEERLRAAAPMLRFARL
jgi:hypothetical protein